MIRNRNLTEIESYELIKNHRVNNSTTKSRFCINIFVIVIKKKWKTKLIGFKIKKVID